MSRRTDTAPATARDLVRLLAGQPPWLKDCHAQIIRFGRFRRHNRDRRKVAQVVRDFETVVGTPHGLVAVLNGVDVGVIYDRRLGDDIRQVNGRIAAMFPFEPCCKGGRIGTENGCLESFDLAADPAAFERSLQRYLGDDDKGRTRVDFAALAGDHLEFNIDRLTQLDNLLAAADISPFLRRSDIYSFGQGRLRRISTEMYVDLADLNDKLAIQFDVTSSPWLFKRLTERFDKRVLRHVAAQADSLVREGLSLNLNVSTLFENEFLQFHQSLSGTNRVPLSIELSLWDLMSDVEEFIFVRNFLHQNGYTVCIDNVPWHALPMLLESDLDVDAIKLIWSPDAVGFIRDPAHRRMVEMLSEQERFSVIMARCDSLDAFYHGADLGISLYQFRTVKRSEAEKALRDRTGIDRG